MTGGAGGVASGAGTIPARGMDQGEAVILDLRPSAWFVVIGSLRELMLIALLGSPAWLLAGAAWTPVGRGLVESVVAALIVARLVWQTMDWGTRSYVLTDRRVIREFGVLRRRRYETLLRNVQSIDVVKSVPERVLGLGTVCFSAASAGGLPEACWVSVARPDEVVGVVRETIRRYGGR